MDEEWFRKMLIEAHDNQRQHLKWIIGGLSREELAKTVSPDEQFPSIQALLWHIAAAETYWFYKSGHSIGSRFEGDDLDTILKKLDENAERIPEVINTCSLEQLRIVPPSPEGGPSVSWASLRTFLHAIYHTAQIAKIRRMIGATPLPTEDNTLWSSAIDSVLNIVHGLLHDSIQF